MKLVSCTAASEFFKYQFCVGEIVVIEKRFKIFLFASIKFTFVPFYCLVFALIDVFVQHFANAGFPCPVMQSPSDHFLRAINTDFDKIISMCKNWQV